MFKDPRSRIADIFESISDAVESKTVTEEEIIAQAEQRAVTIKQYEITTPNQFFFRSREALNEVKELLQRADNDLWLKSFKGDYDFINDKLDDIEKEIDNRNRRGDDDDPDDPWWKKLCRVFRKVVKLIHDFLARIISRFVVNPIVDFFEDRGIKNVKPLVKMVAEAWVWLFDRFLDFLEDGCNNFFRIFFGGDDGGNGGGFA